MKISDILKSKGKQVHSIAPTATLADVVNKLVHCNCGSLMVMHDDRVEGIITERDILRACAADDDRGLAQIAVSEKMTRELISCRSDEEVNASMGLMTNHRIRHLPVINDGQLAGIISIGDVVKAQHDTLTLENKFLKDYIQG